MYFVQLSHDVLLEEVLDRVDERERDKLLRAFAMAHRAHESRPSQSTSRDEGIPPIDHPVRVMYSLFKEQGITSGDLLATALLHDVVEVSEITIEEIRTQFGEKIAAWVDHLTRKEGISRQEYAVGIKEAPYEVFLVEMAARLDNLRTAHRRDKSLQPYFNETYKHFLRYGEVRSKEHPALKVYTEAMRMMMEGD